MTRTVFHSAVLLVLLGSLVSRADAGPSTWREQSERSYDVPGVRVLQVRNTHGTTQVRPSADGRIHLTALKITRSRTHTRAVALAQRVTVEARTEGNRFLVEVHYPQSETVRIGLWDLLSGVELPQTEVRLVVEVPEGFSLGLRSTSGDLGTEGISGAQALESTSGDVSVVRASGPVDVSTASGDLDARDVAAVRVRTSSGDVSIDRPAGPVLARCSSGRIDVQGARDSLALGTLSGNVHVDGAPRGVEVRSTSGDVEAGAAAGRITIETGSGDIQLGLRDPLQSVRVSTSSGDVRVHLDHDVACALEMRTSSGALDVSLPVTLGSVTRRLVTGRVRGGTTPVILRSVSGDIDVLGGGTNP